MSTLTLVLTILVAFQFFYIMYLETFATTSNATSKIFGLSKQELSQPSINTLFKNQGIYNGLLGLGLLYSIFSGSSSEEINRIFLIFIILVAIYGSITSNKKIILTQGGVAILTLIITLF